MIRFLCLVVVVSAVGACRGATSDQPPMYLFPDMDWQEKVQGQEEFAFFPDGRGNRPPVDGTVARGQLHEDSAYWTGKVQGAYLAPAPIKVDAATLARGQDRFNIYCSPCHDRAGSGHGMVTMRAGGVFNPPDFAGERVRGLSDGQIFDTITNGVRNMPSYKVQIPAQDRWVIVTWLRVLQRSQHGSLDDVPADKRAGIEAAP
jgi:mono/diheme cytochrome c family protein